MMHDPHPIWEHPDGRLMLKIFAGLVAVLVSMALAVDYLMLS